MRTALRSRLLVLSVTFAVVLCCGCGSSSTSGQISIAGNWQFTFSSVHGEVGTGSGTITQSGSSFSGTLALTAVCANSAPISGNISGTALSAIMTENGQAVALTGTVASSGQSANGTYTAAAGGCTNGDSGTWSGSDPSISGAFAGTLHPADRLPVGVSLTLKDQDGSVSGVALFTRSVCFDSVALTGRVVGANFNLGGTGAGGTITLKGTLDATGKTLSLESEVSGHCQSESAPGMLTKVQ
jgi:hypothetical protein